jgi:hypothetical protein
VRLYRSRKKEPYCRFKGVTRISFEILRLEMSIDNLKIVFVQDGDRSKCYCAIDPLRCREKASRTPAAAERASIGMFLVDDTESEGGSGGSPPENVVWPKAGMTMENMLTRVSNSLV